MRTRLVSWSWVGGFWDHIDCEEGLKKWKADWKGPGVSLRLSNAGGMRVYRCSTPLTSWISSYIIIGIEFRSFSSCISLTRLNKKDMSCCFGWTQQTSLSRSWVFWMISSLLTKKVLFWKFSSHTLKRIHRPSWLRKILLSHNFCLLWVSGFFLSPFKFIIKIFWVKGSYLWKQ